MLDGTAAMSAGLAPMSEVPTEQVRVFLLDDHEVVREGVRALLESTGEVVVVGEAGTCADAVARVPSTRPDVCILDVRLPDGSGVEVCRDLRESLPGLACLMLTSFADDDALFQAVMAGASGYVLKQIRGTDLLGAVKRVAAGESLIDPKLMGRVLDRLRNPEPTLDPRLASLTPLERSILGHLAEGLTNRQIAGKVHLAEKTVKNYVSSILMKLGMSRRTEAAVFVVRNQR
jgi:two-component system, NarL family, response regulator DevR